MFATAYTHSMMNMMRMEISAFKMKTMCVVFIYFFV